MLIAGAGGHAKDLLTLLDKRDDFFFYDDIQKGKKEFLDKEFKILSTEQEIIDLFKRDNRFVLGLGGPENRKKLFVRLTKLGGKAVSIISPDCIVGSYNIKLGKGINIMPFCFLSNEVTVGDGCLINTRASIHHDTFISNFCDIAPSSTLLGGVEIGENTFIGAGSMILPKVKIGNNCVIGAGSVVTKNIENNSMVFGAPAKKIREIEL